MSPLGACLLPQSFANSPLWFPIIQFPSMCILNFFVIIKNPSHVLSADKLIMTMMITHKRILRLQWNKYLIVLEAQNFPWTIAHRPSGQSEPGLHRRCFETIISWRLHIVVCSQVLKPLLMIFRTPTVTQFLFSKISQVCIWVF